MNVAAVAVKASFDVSNGENGQKVVLAAAVLTFAVLRTLHGQAFRLLHLHAQL